MLKKKMENPGGTCLNKKRDPIAKISFLWYQLESNQRHKDFQSFALPTELWYHRPLGTSKVISFFVSENIF